MIKLRLFFAALSLFFAVTACTDLSKVERESKEDPLEETAPEKEIVVSDDGAPMEKPAEAAVAEVPVPERVQFPFDRVIEDIKGREIAVQVLAKKDGEFAFQRKGKSERFIMPIANLSDKDQTFLSDLDNSGKFVEIKKTMATAAKLSGRTAIWYRDMGQAEKESEELQIPRLTALLIERNSFSKTIEDKVLYSPEFRSWAGKNLVLCLLRVEPSNSRMAMTGERGENRRIAGLYGVKDRAAIMLNFPDVSSNFAVSLANVKTGDDLIREIQIVLDDPAKVYDYIETKDGVE